YKVYFSPPEQPAIIDSDKESLVISNKQSDPVFLPGVNYTFFVTAVNGFGEGQRSETIYYVYGGEVALIKSFKLEGVSENFAKFSWEPANSNVNSYTIILETNKPNSMYTFRNISETDQKSIEFKKLSSGSRYKTPLPKVESLKATFIPNGDVQLSWKPVKLQKASYGIYYGKTLQEIVERSKAQIRTSLTKALVKELEACENYLFDVGLITENDSLGPLTEQPAQLLTKMDSLAPPKNVRVTSEKGIRVKISFDAPCSVMDKAIGYNKKFLKMFIKYFR
ncbi:Receptor-type tyrosine-protein phosphatase delta, partial [Orchesella cincta]